MEYVGQNVMSYSGETRLAAFKVKSTKMKGLCRSEKKV